jgi:hypothetical protein
MNLESERSDSAEEEEEEDEEPRLKYQRLPLSDNESIRNDLVSSAKVSARFLALGHHSGLVSVLDISGSAVIKQFHAHAA